jgi:DNA adenine methylase
MNYSNVRPFIKWAGGKTQLLDEIRKRYPDEINKYCEPFVGGGAVLFNVLANFKPNEILINDINAELINTYTQVRNNVDKLIETLSIMHEDFCSKDYDERKSTYFIQREWFNTLKTNNKQNADLEKAALFIFLNKTCFNGLYRVNGNGLFNVPMGKYKNPLICDSENLRHISKLLKNVQIRCENYNKCLDFIDDNTFVYIDPPYRPLSTTSSFNSYSENHFGDEQQIELRDFVDKISAKNAKIILSNSDPKNTDENDDFFDNLYSNYNIFRIPAKRMINSKGAGRGNITELLISNY